MPAKRKSVVRQRREDYVPPGGWEAPPERWQGLVESHQAEVDPTDTTVVQRSYGGIQQLFDTGRIGGDQLSASVAWCGDTEFGLHGASAPEKRNMGGGESDYATARLNSLTRLQSARRAMGPRRCDLLDAFCVDCLSVRRVAERLEGGAGTRARQRLTVELCDTLTDLAAHYATERAVRGFVRRQRADTLQRREPPARSPTVIHGFTMAEMTHEALA